MRTSPHDAHNAPTRRCSRRCRRCDSLTFPLLCALALLSLLSTLSYVVHIRSHYHPLQENYHALAEATQSMLHLGSLPVKPTAAHTRRLASVQAWDEFAPDELNRTTWRTASRAVDVAAYGLERVECVWRSSAPDLSSSPPPSACSSDMLHAFFLHGNAGSHTQGRYWSCGLQHASDLVGVQVRTYTFRLAEQANVHRGRLVGLQADYVADVVEAVVHRAKASVTTATTLSPTADQKDVTVAAQHRVWLVAHSMGGLVARTAVQLLDSSVALGGVVVFNSPLRFPPLLLDAPMARLYQALAFAERAGADQAVGASPGDDETASQVQMTSEEFVQSCSAMTGSCARQRRRRGSPHESAAARLVSITAGEMDLQIEPTAVYPPIWHGGTYVVSFFNTLNASLCGHSNSHDGILVDACAIALGTVQLLSSVCSPAGASAAVVPSGMLLAQEAVEANAVAQLPLPAGVVTRFGRLGQLLWQQHQWPWAAAALYAYVVLYAVWEHLRRTVTVVVGQRWTTAARPKHARLLGALQQRCAPPEKVSVTAFLVCFYTCTLLYATVVLCFLLCTNQRPWYWEALPWQWESYPQLRRVSPTLAGPFQLLAYSCVFVLLSSGPVAVGTCAGVGIVALGNGIQHVKQAVGRRCAGCVGLRRRWLLTALAPCLVMCLYAVLLLSSTDLTTRAIVWLILFLAVPSCRSPAGRAKRGDDDDGGADEADGGASPMESAALVEPRVCGSEDRVEVMVPTVDAPARLPGEAGDAAAQQHLPGMLFATVYVIQLHPFFTIRNAIVSHTWDAATTADWRNYVVEAELVVLLCCAAAAPSLSAVRRRLPVMRSVKCMCSLVAALVVAWMAAHPAESFRALPALMWCFPCFLYSTVSI